MVLSAEGRTHLICVVYALIHALLLLSLFTNSAVKDIRLLPEFTLLIVSGHLLASLSDRKLLSCHTRHRFRNEIQTGLGPIGDVFSRLILGQVDLLGSAMLLFLLRFDSSDLGALLALSEWR